MALYNLTQEQYLYRAINAANPGAFEPVTFANSLFGTPVAIPPTNPDDPNTEITIRGRQLRGYAGGQTYQYRRLDLGALFKNQTPVLLFSGGIIPLSRAVANINGRYGLNLKPTDVEDLLIMPNTRVDVTIKPECLQYTGKATFYYRIAPPSLADLAVNTVLPIMTHPIDPSEGKRCYTMLAYGIDFSDDYGLLQAFTDGSLLSNANSNLTSALLGSLTARGLPAFNLPGAKIKNVTTANEPRANTQYDYVAVISNIYDPDVAGDILLHYNS